MVTYQPDDPGVDVPKPRGKDMRLSYIIGAVLIFLFFFYIYLLSASAQTMRQFPLVCDLMVNGIRVSWPPGALSERECQDMKASLIREDNTKAQIMCKCRRGDRT